MQTITLSGLHCDACVKLVVKKLSKIQGVTAVNPGNEWGQFKAETTIPLSEETINNVLVSTDYSLVSIKEG